MHFSFVVFYDNLKGLQINAKPALTTRGRPRHFCRQILIEFLTQTTETYVRRLVSKFANTSSKINQQNNYTTITTLQNLLGHLEALPALSVDSQEIYLHLKVLRNKGWTFPHCLVGCLTPKRVNLYYKGSRYTK